MSSNLRMAVLHHIDLVGIRDLRTVSEPLRQRIIDLGMMEPPLVDVDADRIFVTKFGKRKLAKWRQSK